MTNTDSEENGESAKEPKDLMKQPSMPEIKMCIVKLEKIDMNGYSDFESSDEDLPTLPYLLSKNSSKQKPPKSTKELMEEHENLAKNIQVGNICNNNINEKIKRIEIVQVDEVEDVSLSPASVVNEDKNTKVLFVNDTFQFFNIGDVTPEQCGYDSRSKDLTTYERTMLSFKRVELERVLSNFLFSSSICCLSDCKSFITFLLRNLSVHTDVADVEVCHKVLNSILDKHPDAKSLNFSSAEIFMLLFNHGTDINSFKFLARRSDIQRYLGEPKDKSKSKIPEKWMFNFKTTLNAVMSLIMNCEFKVKDLCDIIIYFLWLSLDSSLSCENIFSTVRECISVALDHIPTDKWPKVMREIASAFIAEEFPYSQNEWSYVHHIAESVPFTSKKGLELRKFISFLALTHLGKVELTEGSSEQRAELSKTQNGFSLRELQSLLQRLVEKDSDLLISYATKFLDICISHIQANDEDFNKLCNILKNSESALSNTAHEAKARLVKIRSRLRIQLGKNNMYKVNTDDHERLCKKVKKEIDIDIENVPHTYHFVKVKEEPNQELVSCVFDHNSEKIISFSEFDCENDEEEFDFGSVEKSADISGDILIDVVHSTIKTIGIDSSSITDSNENQNFISDMPTLSSYSVCNTSDQEYVNSKSPTEVSLDDNNESLKNSIIINPPVLEAMVPLDSGDNLSSPVEMNQNRCIDNYRIKEELLKSCEEPLKKPPSYELGSDLAVEFVNSGQNFSHSNEINTFNDTDSGYEFKKDVICEDVFFNAMAITHVAVSPSKQAVSCEDVFTVEAVPACENISTEEQQFSHSDVSVDNPQLSIYKSFVTCLNAPTEKTIHDQIHEEVKSYSTLPESSDNYVEPSVSDQLISNQPVLPQENNDANRTSPALTGKYVNESSLTSLQPDISGTGANCVERINQPDPVELLGNYKSNLPGELSNTPTSYNVESSANSLTKELMETSNPVGSEVITVEEDLENSTLVNSFKDTSDHAEQKESQFNSKEKNCSTSLSELAESLALPKGTEILPVQTNIVSAPNREMPEPSKETANVYSNSSENIAVDEEVVFISEVTLPEKTEKNQKEKLNHVETIELDGSDKDLQILFVKPIPKSRSTSNKSQKDKTKTKHSKSKTKYVIDEEVILLNDTSDSNKTQPSSIKSKSSRSKDLYNNVSNKNLTVTQEDAVLPLNIDPRGIKSSSETMATKSTNDVVNSGNVSDDDGIIFIQHVDSSSKKELCTSQSNMTVMKNNEVIGSENSPVEKSIESIEDRICNNNDINLCQNNLNVDNSISSKENPIPVENNILPECIIENDISVVNVEVEATMNEAILEKLPDLYNGSKSATVNEQESETYASSADALTPTKDGNTHEEEVVMNNCMPVDSTIIRMTFSQEYGKLNETNSDKDVLKTVEQSTKVESKPNTGGKVNLKRKSTSVNIDSQLLQVDFAQNDVNQDVACVLINLRESVVALSETDINKSVHKPSEYTKPLPNNLTNSSFNLPLSSFNKEIISSYSAYHLSHESGLDTLNSLWKVDQEELQTKETNTVHLQSLNSDKRNNNKNNDNKKPVLNYSNDKNLPELNALGGSSKKSIHSKHNSKLKLLPKMSDSHSSKKRKNSEFSSPSSKFRRHSRSSGAKRRFSSHSKFRKSRSSTSPLKYSHRKFYVKNKHSFKKHSDYKKRRTRYDYKNKKKDLLTETGLKLTDFLRENIMSSSSHVQQIPPSSSKTKVSVPSDSDSDVVELYCDPKNYADHECMIVYESEDLIVLDSD